MLKNLVKEFESNGKEDALLDESPLPNEESETTIKRFKVPMSLDSWKWILTKMAQPINDQGQVRALSTMNGYINALKYLHTEQDIILVQDVKIYLKKEI